MSGLITAIRGTSQWGRGDLPFNPVVVNWEFSTEDVDMVVVERLVSGKHEGTTPTRAEFRRAVLILRDAGLTPSMIYRWLGVPCCIHGHRYEGDNVVVYRGARVCVVCRKTKSRVQAMKRKGGTITREEAMATVFDKNPHLRQFANMEEEA